MGASLRPGELRYSVWKLRFFSAIEYGVRTDYPKGESLLCLTVQLFITLENAVELTTYIIEQFPFTAIFQLTSLKH